MNNRVDRANDIDNQLEDQSIRNDLDELSEDINPDIRLSEIGEYNNEGSFMIKEDIKGHDDKGNYIEIRGKKYYENLGEEKGLGYTISKNIANNSDIVYIGNKNGNLNDGYGIEYFSDGRKYKGEWKDGAQHGHGFEVLSGATFEGEYEDGQPKYGIYKRFKNEELYYTYEGYIKSDRNFHFHGRGKINYSDGASYEGTWNEGKFDGNGIYKYPDGTVYDGERKDGKKDGKGIMTYNSGTVYDGEREDGEKNGNGKEKFSNGDVYEGLYINGKRFFDVFNEQQHDYVVGLDNPVEEIEGYGKYTHSNGKIHEYRVNNGTLTEESNSFISMYGDNKPNEDWGAKRGKLIFSKEMKSEGNISYKLKSWGTGPILWKLNGGNYQFKSKNGNILSIPKTTEFGENGSMHAANIINFCMDNARINGTYEFDYKGDTLQAKQSSPRGANTLVGNSGGSMVTGNALTTRYDENAVDLLKKYIWDTDILENIPKHFGGISAEELANWLNSCL